MQKFKAALLLYLKGFSMGAADVVPGVSGGTIAFITGIYDELIQSIRSVNFQSLKILFKEGPQSFWRAINGRFLSILVFGILSSVITLARVIKYLLTHEPILIWSFFFGLIVASVIYVGKQIDKWNIQNILSLLLGAISAYLITISSPAGGIDSLAYIFFSATIAICAMILPGISGSFILLLLGSYSVVLGAVTGFSDALKAGNGNELILYGTKLLVFALGCIIGITLFARLLGYVLNNYRSVTISVLTGFMLGSLNKVWPWKETLEYRLNSSGEKVPFLEENISPFNYAELYATSHQLLWAVLLACLGMILVLGLEKIGNISSN